MRIEAHKWPPSFLAACLVAAGGHVLASLVLGLVLVPLSVVTWSGLALSADPETAGFRLLLPFLLVLAAQPFIAAWIARHLLSLFDAGKVTYWRACGAMVVGLVVSMLSAFVLPDAAAVPVLGYAWTGAGAAALILAAQPKASSAVPRRAR
jgi:hypothetical protein